MGRLPGTPTRDILLDLWQALGTLIILLDQFLSLSLSAGTLRAAAGGVTCDQSTVGYTYSHVWEVRGDSLVSKKMGPFKYCYGSIAVFSQ